MNLDKKFKKYLLLFGLLAFIFFVQSFYITAQEYLKYKKYNKMTAQVILITKISDVIHQLQRERGLSSAFVQSKNKIILDDLKEQKIKTDKAYNKLKKFCQSQKDCLSEFVKKDKKSFLYLLEVLNKQRDAVIKFKLSSQEILDYYSNIDENFLQDIIKIEKNIQLHKKYNDIASLVYINYAKEYAGLKRPVGFELISSKNITPKQKRKFVSLSDRENAYIDLFLEYADKKFVDQYNQILKNPFYNEIEHISKDIVYADPKALSSISPVYWFRVNTKYINALHNLHKSLTSYVIQNIQVALKSTRIELILYILGAFLFALLFVGVIFVLMKMIKDEQRMRQMIDKYIIISSTDTRGIITDASEAFCRISQYSKEELIGKPHNIVRDPIMPKKAFKEMWDTIKSGKKWRGKIRNKKKDGEYYWVDAVIEPNFDKKGKITSYTAIRQDITDAIKLDELNATLEDRIAKEVELNKQKEHQMILQSRHAQMGEMISMIAHQWRQPLSAISSLSGALELRCKLDRLKVDETAAAAAKISEHAQHLSQTINDFRDFFRPDKNIEKTSYPVLIDNALSIIGTSIENKNIKITQEHTETIDIYTYPNEVKQVILNIIKNAEDAILDKQVENGEIKIITNKDTLIIKDNAGGIPENIIEKIFDPYFSTKLKKDGTGLGLYMAKTIIEKHCEGQIKAYNKDGGALFEIVLKNLTNKARDDK